MTNCGGIAAALAIECPNHHRHIRLENGRAKLAEVYPPQLCRAIIKGLVRQMKSDGRVNDGQVGMIVPDEELEIMNVVYEQFYDDISGELLDPSAVHVARQEEMREIKKHRVYRKVPMTSIISSPPTAVSPQTDHLSY